jgi:hypothetical protein
MMIIITIYIVLLWKSLRRSQIADFISAVRQQILTAFGPHRNHAIRYSYAAMIMLLAASYDYDSMIVYYCLLCGMMA